jgi:hypothetical protein
MEIILENDLIRCIETTLRIAFNVILAEEKMRKRRTSSVPESLKRIKEY